MRRLLIMAAIIACAALGVEAQKVIIRGFVGDADGGAALEFANVVLRTVDSVFVGGAVTSSEGRFSIEAKEEGEFSLSVSCIGFESRRIDLGRMSGNRTLEDILLAEEAVALESVTVSASATSDKLDRQLIYPTEAQTKVATNGIDLIMQLMIPKLSVDLLNNTIKLPGGGEPQYRINGVKVESEDVRMLKPSDVVRIEYHDNPGLRYGNAEAVLDYIVRRPETGGNFGLELYDGVTSAFGNNQINGRINHKRSEFSLYYGISHRDFYRMWRDNTETFRFADGTTLRRREAGEPDHGQMLWQNLNAAYNYMNTSRTFNVSFRMYTNNTPHFDYHGTLYNIDYPDDKVQMVDRSESSILRPAIDLYYQENLPNDQTLVLNLVGTYNSTDNTRIYQERRQGVLLTDVSSAVEGVKRSIIGEAIYEKKLGANAISIGIKHTHAATDNRYGGMSNVKSEMIQQESSAYAEYKGKLGKLNYSLASGLMRSYFEQAGIEGNYDKYSMQARLVLQYALPGSSSIRLITGTGNNMPALSDLSAVDQAIDSIQIRRGNPLLRPFFSYRNNLDYNLRTGILNLNLWGIYEYQHRPVMEEKFIENEMIVQTWNNQKNFQRLATRLSLRLGPIARILNIDASGGLNHYISNGNTYRHTYTNPFINLTLIATYKNMSLMTGLETNWDRFMGETMSGGENIHFMMIQYKHKDLALAMGMFNPFVDNYRQRSENRSQYASYIRSNYINESSRLLTLRLNWNFAFGRKVDTASKRTSNTDEDSGVMSTGK
ncbi:MAG: carboxypeptidase-like regulatory domain-containing protein [Tannerellaceae bacterium]|jgi:hypothetical protein|nr:carboxypeptidase-like regulatory domain-containing protein [Tannerellaceae bacterium]